MRSLFVVDVYEEDYDLRITYTNMNCFKSIQPKSHIPSMRLVRQDIIMERNINTPILKIKEKIYDKVLDTRYEILKVERTTDNIIIYTVENKIEITENSIKRKEHLEKEAMGNDMHINCINQMREEQSELYDKIKNLNDLISELEHENAELKKKLDTNTLKENIITKIKKILEM